MQDNWFHIPVGYHGRASTVTLGEGGLRRPKGQVRPKGEKLPKWSECKRLDFELEVGAFVGKSNPIGTPIKVKDASDYIFGLSLMNDWSARDIQVWEYVPLGPFNAKNFSTQLSPWIITSEALEPFRRPLPPQTDPEPLPYLQEGEAHSSYDIDLFVDLGLAEGGKPHTITKTNFTNLYWSVAQQLTHHAVTGCSMQVGDLLGSGTISGPEPSAFGSMMELSWAGQKPMELDGVKRTFLNDGDTVTLRGECKSQGYTLSFGNCSGTILPALPDSNYF